MSPIREPAARSTTAELARHDAGASPEAPDPRLEAAARSIETGDWRALAEELGSIDEAGTLPPTLGLLCALAHHEAGAENAAQAANDLAIRCVGALFGLPPDSAIPLLIAKRLLRKNPAAWRTRQAPPARTSLLIIAMTLSMGGAIGWFLSSNIAQLMRAKLHL